MSLPPVTRSGKQRRARLDAIRIACQAYIAGPLTAQFTQLAASVIPYDVHQLMQAASAHEWQADHALAIDCVQHARLFFGSADLGLDTAIPGTFTLTPSAAMRDALARDYAAMSGMIFGEIPALDAVLASAEKFEQIVNGATTAASLAQEERH